MHVLFKLVFSVLMVNCPLNVCIKGLNSLPHFLSSFCHFFFFLFFFCKRIFISYHKCPKIPYVKVSDKMHFQTKKKKKNPQKHLNTKKYYTLNIGKLGPFFTLLCLNFNPFGSCSKHC